MKTQLSPQRNSYAETSVEQIADRIIASGRITRADERFFMQAALSDIPPSEEEMTHIKRVVDRLQMGLLRVLD